MVEPFNEQMGQMTTAGMTGQIDEELSAALLKSLSKGIPATVVETIPYVVSEGLAESLMLYVTEQVTNELTDPLSSRLAKSLGATVPKQVNGEGSVRLADRVTHVTIHSLTRSLARVLVVFKSTAGAATKHSRRL